MFASVTVTTARSPSRMEEFGGKRPGPQQVSRWSLPLLSPDTLFNSRLANVLGAIVVLVISALAVLQLARVLGLAG